MKSKLFSTIGFIFISLILIYTNLFFYPTWQNGRSQATISWDVAGYYCYLPAVFINHDLFTLEKTRASTIEYGCQEGDFYSAQLQPNHKYIMKYSMGNAILYLPFFMVAHVVATCFHFNADGFSIPYQAGVSWGCLIYALLSLWLLFNILIQYFDLKSSLATLLLLVIGTNYLEYAAISNALAHNQLFFLYCLIIYCTIEFYKNPKSITAIAIGGIIGLAVLTRPTEIIIIIIPLLWNVYSAETFKNRLNFISKNIKKYVLVSCILLMCLGLQLIYWKMASNHWIQFTYNDEHFDWLHPHIINGLWSFRKGWFIYTPIMFLPALASFFYINKTKIFFMYVAFSCL